MAAALTRVLTLLCELMRYSYSGRHLFPYFLHTPVDHWTLAYWLDIPIIHLSNFKEVVEVVEGHAGVAPTIAVIFGKESSKTMQTSE